MSYFSLRWSSTQTRSFDKHKSEREILHWHNSLFFSSYTTCKRDGEQEVAELIKNTKPEHMAVINSRLLILQLITDRKKNPNKPRQRCYNKIANTSTALDRICKIHRKKFPLFYLLTVWVTTGLAIKVHKPINTVCIQWERLKYLYESIFFLVLHRYYKDIVLSTPWQLMQ